MSALDLKGRVAVVTGAAGGFGRVFTRSLLEAGAKVAALDVAEDPLVAFADTLKADGLGAGLMTHACDIGVYGARAEAIERVRTEFGDPDILVNNAALGMGVIRADHMTNLVSIDDLAEIWDQFVAVNLSGGWYLTKLTAPAMLSQGWGRIFDVTTSFFTMLRGKFHPYGPSKAGFEAMAAGHAQEFEGTGVTVNVIVPGGPSDTAMVPPEYDVPRDQLIPTTAMLGPFEFLLSEAGAEVTGKRFIAANWDRSKPIEDARAASESPIAWPDLTKTAVWPSSRAGDLKG